MTKILTAVALPAESAKFSVVSPFVKTRSDACSCAQFVSLALFLLPNNPTVLLSVSIFTQQDIVKAVLFTSAVELARVIASAVVKSGHSSSNGCAVVTVLIDVPVVNCPSCPLPVESTNSPAVPLPDSRRCKTAS